MTDRLRPYAARVTLVSSIVWATCAAGGSAHAQTSNLYNRYLRIGQPVGSWTQQPATPVDPIKLYDIVSVRVDELARMTSEGEVQRRKSGQYDAILLDWVKLIGLFTVKPAPQADGDPHVQGTLDQTLRSQSDMETRQSVAFNIACQVVDIRPNGNLVLEGHKEIRINQDAWVLSLSGECSAKDVGPGRTVLSQDIVSMKVDKRERGHGRDGYKRGWFLRWFDEFHPF